MINHFPTLEDLNDTLEYQLSPNDILFLYNKEAPSHRKHIDTQVIIWLEQEAYRRGWQGLRWFLDGGSRGCFLMKLKEPLPTVKFYQEIVEKSVAELLTTAVTKITQHACRQGGISNRMWPPLSELPEPESWRFVGRKYAREIAIEIMQMYFSKGNFLTDLAKLAGRDSE